MSKSAPAARSSTVIPDVWDSVWVPAALPPPVSSSKRSAAVPKAKKMGKKDWVAALLQAAKSEDIPTLQTHLQNPSFSVDAQLAFSIWLAAPTHRAVLDVLKDLPAVKKFDTNDVLEFIQSRTEDFPHTSGGITTDVLEIFATKWTASDFQEALVNATDCATALEGIPAQLSVIEFIQKHKPSLLPRVIKECSAEIIDSLYNTLDEKFPAFFETPKGNADFKSWCQNVFTHLPPDPLKDVLNLFLKPQKSSDNVSMSAGSARISETCQHSDMSYSDCIVVHSLMSDIPFIAAPITESVRDFSVFRQVSKSDNPKLWPLLASWSSSLALPQKQKSSPSVMLSVQPKTFQELLWASAAPAIFQMSTNPNDAPVLKRLSKGSQDATALFGLNAYRALSQKNLGGSLSSVLSAAPDLVTWRDPSGNTLGHWILAGLNIKPIPKIKPILDALLPTVASKAPEWLSVKNNFGHTLLDVLATNSAWSSPPLTSTRAQWSKKELSLNTKFATSTKSKAAQRRM